MAKHGLTGIALTGCLLLTSCNSSSGLRPASVFEYPEAKAYMSCFVDYSKKRVLSNKPQDRSESVLEIIDDAYGACAPIETKLMRHVFADGLSPELFNRFTVELRDKASNLAWDEVAPIRLAHLKAEGAIR